MPKTRLYNFKKVKGKWTSSLNPKFFLNLYTEHGLPFEIAIDEYKKKPLEYRLSWKLEDWKSFAKENNISLDEIRENNKRTRYAKK